MRRHTGVAVLFCLAGAWPWPGLAGELREAIPAESLVLRDAVGALRLEASPDDRVHVDLSWDAPLTVEARQEAGGVLAVVVTGWPTASGQTIVGQSTRIEMGAGATSSVVIGGTVFQGRGAAGGTPRLEGTLRLPEGMDVRLEGGLGALTGDAAIGALRATVAGAADVALRVAGPVDLDLSGAGRWRLTGPMAQAAVRTTGAAAVDLDGCATETLTVSMTGAGRLAVACPVTTATVAIVGAGEVRLRAVSGPLETSILGGTLVVENR